MLRVLGPFAALVTLVAAPAARADEQRDAFEAAARAWVRAGASADSPRVVPLRPPAPPTNQRTRTYVGAGLLIAGSLTGLAAISIMCNGAGYMGAPLHLSPPVVLTGIGLGIATPFLWAGGASLISDAEEKPGAAAWIEKGGGGATLRFRF